MLTKAFVSGRVRGFYFYIAGFYLVSLLLERLLGIRFVFDALFRFWQYLDVLSLKQDLLRSLYYLHSQPPLFNWFLGIVIQLFSENAPIVFLIVFRMLAVGTLLLMAHLMRMLGVSDYLILLLCALFVIFPTFSTYSNLLFYTLPAAFLLLLSAVCLFHWHRSESRIWLFLFLTVLTSLMLTRSVYHLVWLVGACILLATQLQGKMRKQFVLGSLLPFLIVLLLYSKNFALVGNFGPSSWMGMNLANGWIVPFPKLHETGAFLSWKEAGDLHQQGKISREWMIGPFQTPNEFERLGYFSDSLRLHPAWGVPYKSGGIPNYNHRDYAKISRVMLKDDWAIIREYPWRFAKRVVLAFRMYLQPGPRRGWFFEDYYDFSKVERWRDSLSLILLWGPPAQIAEAVIPFNFLFLIFPASVIFGFYVRRESAVYPYMAFAILWVALTANLLEFGENDRMRWETDPIMFVSLGCLISYLLKRRLKAGGP